MKIMCEKAKEIAEMFKNDFINNCRGMFWPTHISDIVIEHIRKTDSTQLDKGVLLREMAYMATEAKTPVINYVMRIRHLAKLGKHGLEALTEDELNSVIQIERFYKEHQQEFDNRLNYFKRKNTDVTVLATSLTKTLQPQEDSNNNTTNNMQEIELENTSVSTTPQLCSSNNP